MRSSAVNSIQPGRASRKRLPIVATVGALVVACAVAGAALRQSGGNGPAHARTVAHAIAPLPAAEGGNLSQADTRGGAADSQQFLPAAADAANALPAIPRGGYAEYLHDHPAAAVTGATVSERPLGGYAEWLLWQREAAVEPATN